MWLAQVWDPRTQVVLHVIGPCRFLSGGSLCKARLPVSEIPVAVPVYSAGCCGRPVGGWELGGCKQ